MPIDPQAANMAGMLTLQVMQLEAQIGVTQDTYVIERLQAAKQELARASAYLRTPIAPAIRFTDQDAIPV